MGRFDALKRSPANAKQDTPTLAVARRGNPDYRQFSAYVPADLYRTFKVRLAERDLELSQAVEEAIAEWLRKG